MFKSITFTQFDSIEKCFIYKITDSDFEFDIKISENATTKYINLCSYIVVISIIEEYKRRGINETYNLFLYFIHFINVYPNLIYLFNIINKDITHFFPDYKYSELYHDKLVKMYEQYKLFL